MQVGKRKTGQRICEADKLGLSLANVALTIPLLIYSRAAQVGLQLMIAAKFVQSVACVLGVAENGDE